MGGLCCATENRHETPAPPVTTDAPRHVSFQHARDDVPEEDRMTALEKVEVLRRASRKSQQGINNTIGRLSGSAIPEKSSSKLGVEAQTKPEQTPEPADPLEIEIEADPEEEYETHPLKMKNSELVTAAEAMALLRSPSEPVGRRSKGEDTLIKGVRLLRRGLKSGEVSTLVDQYNEMVAAAAPPAEDDADLFEF